MISRSAPARRGICLAAAVLSAGCYGYVAPAPGASLAGRDAQLSLSDSGAVMLASSIGPGADAVSGRVVTDTGSAYVIALSAVRHRDGDETSWRGERLVVPRALVVDAGQRRFSPSRTALFGGIVSAGLLAARLGFQGRGSGGGGGGVVQSGGLR